MSEQMDRMETLDHARRIRSLGELLGGLHQDKNPSMDSIIEAGYMIQDMAEELMAFLDQPGWWGNNLPGEGS